ncbi:hypothetical protein BAMA_02280 [Bacillus manliponensis]|uniref:Lipoprotein n=1 Tax=Bacillus manliponensis TaxID=574376 RepID=A0A073K9K7_9BACI|nr:hypothetical protein BAMA_02280 [Bacillus manliponensis]
MKDVRETKILKLFVTALCILLLSACEKEGIEGAWELSQSEQNECPTYYKFEIVVKEEDENQVVYQVVNMYTNEKKKENKYVGTYTQVNKEGLYLFNYGNDFTSEQWLEREGESLRVFFPDVNKQCTYKLSS